MDVAGGSEVCISLKSVHCALLTRSCFQPPGEEAEPHPRLLNAEPPECGHQGRGIYFYITVIILHKKNLVSWNYACEILTLFLENESDRWVSNVDFFLVGICFQLLKTS